MPDELSIPDLQNILSIMSRVNIQGNEAHAYVVAEMKLKAMLKRLTDASVSEPSKQGAKEDT